MFKFMKWYWRKAQAAAATEILARARRYGSVQSGRVVVDMERLEDFVAKGFIIPSKEDDNPRIEISSNGIPPINSAALSKREESGRHS